MRCGLACARTRSGQKDGSRYASLAELNSSIFSIPVCATGVRNSVKSEVFCLFVHGFLQVVEAAHKVGLSTTSTLMFGHVEDGPTAWATHLLAIR